MMYAQSKGIYYVQLEDDIVAKPNYLSTMKNFALQQPSEDWMILEFSQLGFIGKMFKSLDLSLIVEFILMFYRDKPIDWLLDHILWVKVCNPEKDAKHCDRQKANLRIRFKPSLFQHVGTHSSLAGKIQKLKDKDFGKQALRKEHVNPPAEVSTSLKTYQHFTLEKAYLREDFFWAFTLPRGTSSASASSNPYDWSGFSSAVGTSSTRRTSSSTRLWRCCPLTTLSRTRRPCRRAAPPPSGTLGAPTATSRLAPSTREWQRERWTQPSALWKRCASRSRRTPCVGDSERDLPEKGRLSCGLLRVPCGQP